MIWPLVVSDKFLRNKILSRFHGREQCIEELEAQAVKGEDAAGGEEAGNDGQPTVRDKSDGKDCENQSHGHSEAQATQLLGLLRR